MFSPQLIPEYRTFTDPLKEPSKGSLRGTFLNSGIKGIYNKGSITVL